MKTKSRAALPPLAPTLPSVLGPVPVSRVEDLRERESGQECLGIWRSYERDVRIAETAVPVAAWHTYWHEWAHIVFWGAGVKLDKDVEERVCDALATARVREMLDAVKP